MINQENKDTRFDIYFHLAENKNNETKPFAFLATCTSAAADQLEFKHIPLNKILEKLTVESRDDRTMPSNRDVLLALLLPIKNASINSQFLKQLVDSGDLFKPLLWKGQQAYEFLKDIPIFENEGIKIRIPDWWNVKNHPRPQVSISIGEESSGLLGTNGLLDFKQDLRITKAIARPVA